MEGLRQLSQLLASENLEAERNASAALAQVLVEVELGASFWLEIVSYPCLSDRARERVKTLS